MCSTSETVIQMWEIPDLSVTIRDVNAARNAYRGRFSSLRVNGARDYAILCLFPCYLDKPDEIKTPNSITTAALQLRPCKVTVVTVEHRVDT